MESNKYCNKKKLTQLFWLNKFKTPRMITRARLSPALKGKAATSLRWNWLLSFAHEYLSWIWDIQNFMWTSIFMLLYYTSIHKTSKYRWSIITNQKGKIATGEIFTLERLILRFPEINIVFSLLPSLLYFCEPWPLAWRIKAKCVCELHHRASIWPTEGRGRGIHNNSLIQ